MSSISVKSTNTSQMVTVTAGRGAEQANAEVVRNRGQSTPASNVKEPGLMAKIFRKNTEQPERAAETPKIPQWTQTASTSLLTKTDQINIRAYVMVYQNTQPKEVFYGAYATVEGCFSGKENASIGNKQKLGEDIMEELSSVIECEQAPFPSINKKGGEIPADREKLLKDEMSQVIDKKVWGELSTDRKSSERAG